MQCISDCQSNEGAFSRAWHLCLHGTCVIVIGVRAVRRAPPRGGAPDSETAVLASLHEVPRGLAGRAPRERGAGTRRRSPAAARGAGPKSRPPRTMMPPQSSAGSSPARPPGRQVLSPRVQSDPETPPLGSARTARGDGDSEEKGATLAIASTKPDEDGATALQLMCRPAPPTDPRGPEKNSPFGPPCTTSRTRRRSPTIRIPTRLGLLLRCAQRACFACSRHAPASAPPLAAH